MAGLAFTLFSPMFHSSIPVYPLPGPPPALHSIVEAVSNTSVDWVLVAPIMLQSMAQDSQALAAVSTRVQHLVYIGGAAPQEAADLVASKLPLYQVFGSSEFGSFPLVYREPLSQGTDWQSVEFHPQAHAQLRHRFGNLHELVLVNNLVHGRPNPVFAVYPHLREYETGDLFAPHPDRPNAWVYESRADDLIVYLTGEKTNPAEFERIVGSHAEVRDVLMLGDARFESALLIEPCNSASLSRQETRQVIDRIWPLVRHANSLYPGYAHVSPSKILLTEASRPMARSAKGTVQRKATLELYKQDISAMYNELEDAIALEPRENLDVTSRESVSQVVQDLIHHLTGWNEVQPDADFFSLGMDSLIVHRLSRHLQLHLHLAWIEPKTIYSNPSVESLSQVIVESSGRRDADVVASSASSPANRGRLARMTEILHAQKAALSALCREAKRTGLPPHPPKPERHVVLLTGSTGNVGSFVLDKLVGDESISHVYCLNRSQDSEQAQIRSNARRGLATALPSSKVTFLTADLGRSDLGISPPILDTIKSSITTIVHNAWPVDFNLSVSSFKPSLQGLVNLLSLAAHSAHAPSLIFLSSISATANYHQTPQAEPAVPETILRDMESPAVTGYGESKFISELLLQYASQEFNLRTGIVRIGQITGSVDSLRGWNRNEWFPILIRSSKHIGSLPETLGSADEHHPNGYMGDIDWIPVDRLNGLIVDFVKVLAGAGAEAGSDPLVVHAVNPLSTSWADVLPDVRSTLSAIGGGASEEKDVSVTPYAAWVSALAAGSSASDGSETRLRNPGYKLLDFYSQMSGPGGAIAKLGTSKTRSLLPAILLLEPLRAEWMAGWIRDWFSAD
ncbi:hypothetical protein UVI_02023020 [Ustilaginoidea virens]|nr:hypothetical protein UVI_02023020 [Ustilaginoidea virens]